MKKLRNNKIRKLLAFMVALALMVSCMPSAYTISASEAFGDGTEDIFTDGEITSEPAAEESTPDVSSADQEETEQAQQSTLTYENDSVKVTAEALEDGALPQNTALKADGVNENSSVSYDTVSQKLSAAATDKGSSLRGFFAYDVYFADGDGNRVEPNGRVRVTFEYKTPAAPELTDAASTSVTVEKLHYNSSTGDTDVNTLQANEDLKVLNVNEGKQIQTLQVETGNAAVFAVMWDSPETADVEAEAVSGNEDEVSIASEELTDGMDISDEPEQDAAETPAAENPEVTPDAEPSEAPAENPDAEPTEAPTEDPDVVEEPAEDIASPDEVPAADENGETSLIEVLGDDTNLRVSPSIEAEVLATVNAGTQLTLLDTVTAEDGATWYKVSWEGTEAYIRSDMAQVVDSSEEAEEPEDVQEEEIQPEITRYDYTSGEVNVKVTLTDPADLPDDAKLFVTPVELSQEAEDQITEEAIKEKKAIEKIHSYDIKFLVDGEEVQPGASVKVSVSLNDEKKIKDADVYHVDENDNVENMDGSVAKNGDVEFETTHFSTYVIVGNKRDDKIKVTIEHYDETTGEKIYADDVDKELSVGQKIDCKKATNWDITRVDVVKNETTTTVNEGDIELAQDATVKVYYTPTTGTFAGAPTFYDYTVKAGEETTGPWWNQTTQYYSINQTSNYSGSGKKLSMGETGQNYDVYRYNWTKGGHEVNQWTKSDAVITGLLGGLDNSGNVVFNYPEPGFFKATDLLAGSSKDNYLRKVYTDYNLNFERIGDTYTLTGVTDGNGTNVTNQYTLDKKKKSGEDFFPLDTVASSYEKSNKRKTDNRLDDDGKIHNYYFGMRYDIQFNLGGYVGPLSYTFTGDDDMWVVMDGGKDNQQIIIDLGGIHNAATKTVDLWDYLEEGDTSTHTLTVLYMERGAGASNCYMNFTLPNATISQVTTDALGTLNLQKVKSDKTTGLSGAKFALYSDKECTTQIATATSGAGGYVTFDKLRAGTYYLKEIQAPAGYVTSNEVWTVIATKESKTSVKVELKDSAGNAVENNHIINQTKQEFIDSKMDYDKTVKVNDWDKRTYDITITADSKVTSSTTEEKDSVADIMMVFDTTGSMLYNGSKGTDKGGFKKFGEYKQVKAKLDTSKVYYFTNETTDIEYTSGWDSYSYPNAKNPMIYLNNQWIYYNGSSWENVPDNSSNTIYTLDSSLTGLKEAATTFIASTAAASPNSRIGLATFNTSGTLKQELIEVGSAKDSLIKATDCVYASGGTSPQTGLEIAQNQLKTKRENVPQYVILFTDGDPSTSNDKTASKNKAEALRKAGVKVFTIGLKLNDITKKWLSGEIASEGCAYTAGSIDELKVIFEKIQQTITQNIDIAGAEIKDVIDPRFVIVKNGEFVTNEMIKNAGGSIDLGNGGVVSVDESTGNQVVKWTNQTIPNAENGTWSRTITVRAKDEYIGGNNVPTNVSPDSKITTGYGKAVLPQPKVNVKSDLFVNNKETTIFYGDTVPTTEDIINALFNKNAPQGRVKQLDGTENLVTYTIGADGKPINSDEFELKWYEDEKCTKEILEEKMAQVKPEPESKTYYLKVTYKNKGLEGATDKSTDNTGGNISGKGDGTLTAHNSKDDKKREYGVYTIHIIAGQIQITKKLESTAKEAVTFTFDVKKGKDKIATATATIEAGRAEATITFALEKNADAQINTDMPALTKLARGEYTVSEVSNSSYTLKSATVGEVTNCKSEVTNSNEIKFTIGTDTHSTEVLKNGNKDTKNGRIGVAEFTNEKSVANVELEKVDKADHGITIKGAKFALYEADGNWGKASENSVEGYGEIVSGDNGKIEMKNLPVGNYLLYETEAATGYTCPTEPWRIIVGSGGTVTVQDGNGNLIASKSESEPAIYQIENTKVYSLPESGGPGTYGFTISGVAILATALLLFINNKRREEEAKRS